MMAVPDVLILLVVYGVAFLYSLITYASFAIRNGVADAAISASERLGMSVVLGALLFALVNNYLSAIIGSRVTGVALVALPVAYAVYMVWRHGWRSLSWPNVRHDATAAAVCLLFVLAVGHRLFFWSALSSRGLLHPDLPYHVGRVMQQAFQSSPGFWPPSPLAFPGPLQFTSLVADSLISGTFRYLPFDLYAYHYAQVLFAWLIVLWTGVVLIAGAGAWRSLTVLTVALLLAPLVHLGAGAVGMNLFVLFHANPNSAVTWPMAFALSFHIYRSFRRGSGLSLPFLLLIPPLSLFGKTNHAFAFAFLQVAGVAVFASARGVRAALKLVVAVGAVWFAAILLALTMGRSPVPLRIQPSLDTVWYHARVALPHHASSSPQLLSLLLTYLFIVVLTSIVAVLVRSGPHASRVTIAAAIRCDVVIPAATLVLAAGYLLSGWVAIAPTPGGEGEPMHVNFDLIVWLVAVFVTVSLCSVYEIESGERRWTRARMGLPAVVTAAVLAVAAFWIGRLNYQSDVERGALPVTYFRAYDNAAEGRIRRELEASIPGGHCFDYGRRYALDVGAQYDPDSAIAMTGCPVINGRRWRGNLGNNEPERLRGRPTIDVNAGGPFRLIPVGNVPR